MARHANVLFVTAPFVMAATMAASPVQAAERQQISIAPGRLGEAAISLGRQTGVSIGMSDQSLTGIATPAVQGRMSVEGALKRLLKGSGASIRRIGDGTFRIVRDRAIGDGRAREQPRLAVALPAPEPEQEPAEIIVTASKRDTPLPRYAGMVEVVGDSAFTAGEAAGGSAGLIFRVASLSSTHAGAGRNKLFIRAIADSGVAGPTQATTGQYLGDMRLNYAAPDPDLKLYDMQGVEVLEGPQGTLYGAGSLGGIVRMIPNAPNLVRTGGQVSAGLSATQHGDPGGDLAATINLPIVTEKIALRVVGYGVQDGGYIDNVHPDRRKDDVNRTRTYGGRAALRFAPDEDWTIDVTGVYQRIDADDAQYAAKSIGDLKRASAVAQPYSSDYALANLRVERQWDDLRFLSSTGFVRNILTESFDATQPDGPAALFRQRNKVDIFSTENRIVRDLDNGLGWILGASYLESTSDIQRTLTSYGTEPVQAEVIPGVPMYGRGMPATSTGVRNRIREATLFGEASFEPIAGLIATVGGRLTNSRLSGEALDPIAFLSMTAIAKAEAQANRNETIFLPSFSLLTDAVPGMTLYARFQQGFRPGGLAVDDQHIQRFRNDRASTLEFGFRSGVPGVDAVALTGNVAHTKWRDIQADVTDRIGIPTTANIGDGRIYTVEGRIALHPLPRLTLDGSIIYNDSRLNRPTQFVQRLSYKGQSLALPNVANWGGRVGFDYRAPVGGDMRFHLSGSARYVGKSRLGVGPILGREQGDYVDTALSASLTRGMVQWSLSLSNLLDSSGNRFSLGTPFDLREDYVTPLRPRTVRVGMDFAF
ncbi:TonB-dependent receptor domain-containing protein [Sphingobium chlorophenolicum]|uniref:Secretin/TonB short domain protein n=1 Tax=Sphingobium chlorophenolicum TaxID=46429 RepID=A0A081R7Z4_SPHCR|nr:TonB-dependent receptor [Sphingobium chlorophenolicum]KEQ51317.1 Secretin/TonB short domain protein precursor [Sphingobium chlorophenolicum]